MLILIGRDWPAYCGSPGKLPQVDFEAFVGAGGDDESAEGQVLSVLRSVRACHAPSTQQTRIYPRLLLVR